MLGCGLVGLDGNLFAQMLCNVYIQDHMLV